MKKDNSFLINYSLNFLFYFSPCYEVHIFIYFSIFISVFLMQFFIIIVANFSTKQVPLRLIAQIIPLFCPNFGLIPYSIFERFHWWISNLASDQRVSNIRKSSIVKYEKLPIQLCNANSSSLPLIFAKCMNDFFLSLFFYVSSSIGALWSEFQSSLFKVKKMESSRTLPNAHTSFTPIFKPSELIFLSFTDVTKISSLKY